MEQPIVDRRRGPRVQFCTELATPSGDFLGTELSSVGVKALSDRPVEVGMVLPIEARFFTGRVTRKTTGIVRRVEEIETAPGWRNIGIEIELSKRDVFARAARLRLARSHLRWPLRPWASDASQVVSRLVSEPLPEAVEYFARDWSGPRDRFIWSWVQEGLELVTLSSVPGDLRRTVAIAKQLGVMLNALMDDVADTSQDQALLERLVSQLLSPGTVVENEDATLRTAQRLRDQFFEVLRTLPRYREFERFLFFDLRQMANAMRYAQLVNGRVEHLNRSEQELYQHHNMFMMVCATIDLMASPDVDRREVGLIRSAATNGQIMGAIGNMLTTWQRELRQGDFSSAVFSLAVEQEAVTIDDLRAVEQGARAEHVEDAIIASDVEQKLLDTWGARRERVRHVAPRVRTVDFELYDLGLEMLLGLSLAAWGLT